MQQAKAILFDLDGTLIDSELSHYKCWNALLFHFGKSLDQAVYMQQYAGVALAVNAQKLIDTYHLDVQLDDMIQRREKLMLQTFRDDDISLMPHALETITFFYEKRVPLALVTSSSGEEVAVILQKLGLQGFFRHIITRDDVTNVKPHPEPYEQAVKRMGVDKKDCIVIEDTLSGIHSATAAGITSLAVQQTPSPEFTAAGAIHTFPDLAAATTFLCTNYHL